MELGTISIILDVKDIETPGISTRNLVKIYKINKPYIICNDYGVQLFVRKEEGIILYNNLITK